MQKTARVFEVRDIIEGVGQRGPWKNREIVLITDERYPKKSCYLFRGDNVDKLASVMKDDLVTIDFEPESNFNETHQRYFTQLEAWNIVVVSRTAAPAPAPTQEPAETTMP